MRALVLAVVLVGCASHAPPAAGPSSSAAPRAQPQPVATPATGCAAPYWFDAQRVKHCKADGYRPIPPAPIATNPPPLGRG